MKVKKRKSKPLPAPKTAGIKVEFHRDRSPPRIPNGRNAGGRPSVYHLELLDPGMSIEIEGGKIGNIAAAISRRHRASPGTRYTMSRLKNGNIGVWRLR